LLDKLPAAVLVDTQFCRAASPFQSFLEAEMAVVQQPLPLCYRAGWRGAVDAYERALSVAPDLEMCCFSRCMVLLLQGRLAEAVDAYERALSAAPNFEIVRNNLAIALTELGTRTKLNGAQPEILLTRK